jgi:hypothetical protein
MQAHPLSPRRIPGRGYLRFNFVNDPGNKLSGLDGIVRDGQHMTGSISRRVIGGMPVQAWSLPRPQSSTFRLLRSRRIGGLRESDAHAANQRCLILRWLSA